MKINKKIYNRIKCLFNIINYHLLNYILHYRTMLVILYIKICKTHIVRARIHIYIHKHTYATKHMFIYTKTHAIRQDERMYAQEKKYINKTMLEKAR